MREYPFVHSLPLSPPHKNVKMSPPLDFPIDIHFEVMIVMYISRTWLISQFKAAFPAGKATCNQPRLRVIEGGVCMGK